MIHVDLCRIGDTVGPASIAACEAMGLEYDELLSDQAVTAVEWSEYWEDPPDQRLEIHLDRPESGEFERILRIESVGHAWTSRQASVCAVLNGLIKHT